MSVYKLQKCVCLQVNGKGKKTTYVADKETGKVIRIYKGNGKDFPTILKGAEINDDLYLEKEV